MVSSEKQQSPNPMANWTLREKFDFVAFVSSFPALTVMVLLRHRLGFNIVKPWRLLLMAALLGFGPTLMSDLRGNVPFAPTLPDLGYNLSLAGFAVLMLAAGLGQRWRRWQEFQHGTRWHSFYPGDSFLTLALNKLPFPLWHHWVRRFIEPTLVIMVGLVMQPFAVTHALGVWFIIAGFGLYSYEYVGFIRNVEMGFLMQDGLSRNHLHTVFYGRTGERPAPPKKATILPTGPASDTARLRAIREGRAAGDAGTAATLPPKKPDTVYHPAPALLVAALLGLLLLGFGFSYAMSKRPRTTSAVSPASGTFSSLLSELPSQPASGDAVNVAGQWHGSYSVNSRQTLDYLLTLSQNGINVSGTADRRIRIFSGGSAEVTVSLSGVAAADAVTLHETRIEKQTGNSTSCLIKTLTLTPTGDGSMRAHWQKLDETSCPAGELTLTR